MKNLSQKLLYGLVETGINAAELFIRLHLLVFYSKDMGLSTFWVGVALSISILWDAAIDPWIGRISDQFKIKYGTRMHLVLAGAILTTLFLVALYHPPTFLETDKLKWTYLLIASLLFNTAFTLFSIPYAAMVGDYTSDRSERAQFIAWRLGFANLGAIMGIAVPGFFLIRNPQSAYGYASIGIALVIMTTTLLGSLSPPPKTTPEKLLPEETSHPFQSILRNKPFLLLVVAYFIVNVGLTFNSSAALFFYRMRVQLNEQEIQNMLMLFLLVFSASIPVWLLIAKWVSRKWALFGGAFILGASNFVVYPMLPPGNPIPTYIWASSFGGFFVGCSVLLESILTDVIDYDFAKSKKEKFGLYFGVWKFSAKFSRAVALLLTGTLLDWANVAFPDVDTSNRLAIIFGPGVGSFFILAALAIIPYGLNEKQMVRVKRILDRRRSV